MMPAVAGVVILAGAIGGSALAADASASAKADLAALPPAVRDAVAHIDGERLHGDVAFLADDLLEGRGTGTRGYDLAARYVANRFATLGLVPGGSAGYLQPVPFRCATSSDDSTLALVRDGKERPLTAAEGVVSSDVVRTDETVEAPLVYVGYGVAAPELGYDDFGGVDVRGKVVVELRGAPPRFGHDERAFYSSSLQKARMAAERGAVGVIGVTKPSEQRPGAWDRMLGRRHMESCRWVDEHGEPTGVEPTLRLAATLSRAGADLLFAGAPETFEQAGENAEKSIARSFLLAGRVRSHRVSTHRETVSPNVIGVLRGSDPALASEAIVVSAHLDHLGMLAPTPAATANGQSAAASKADTIYNGAYDNGSGTAMMLELARAMTVACLHGSCPRRSIVFLAVTGEEKGLQGSDYFARHPAPRAGDLTLRVVGNVNVDEILLLRPVTHVVGFGAEHTSLGPLLERAAAMVGITVMPDPRPEEVIFVRSDQFSFVRQGIPGIFPVSAMDGGPEAIAAERAWDRQVYHSPADDMSQVFDWESGARFTRMAFLLTWMAADETPPPHWNAGDFFATRFGHEAARPAR